MKAKACGTDHQPGQMADCRPVDGDYSYLYITKNGSTWLDDDATRIVPNKAGSRSVVAEDFIKLDDLSSRDESQDKPAIRVDPYVDARRGGAMKRKAQEDLGQIYLVKRKLMEGGNKGRKPLRGAARYRGAVVGQVPRNEKRKKKLKK